MAKEQEWPRTARSPAAITASPDGYLRSSRSLAGPLRTGTAAGVGPRDRGGGDGDTDYGVDRVSPRHFDPMGTSDTRAPPFPESTRIRGSRQR